MDIRILGCYGNSVRNFRTTSFLINNSVLLDAGAVTEFLDGGQLKKISRIIITHTHLDHIKDLVFLVDELVMMGKFSIELVSVKPVIDIISKDLFNNRLWPDFTVIPSKNEAVIKFREIEIDRYANINGLDIKPILMTHTVYTVGYVVKEGGRGFMFTSDTGPTEKFWKTAKEEEGIRFIIADVSFPNRMKSLAEISGHMTLDMLTDRLDRYGLNDKLVYISHMKPVFFNEILENISTAKRENILMLEQGGEIKI